ncbi:MAG: LptA/OstA family protein [Pseudomonadota bacterium]|nr:LptA/OstA family protein [Pseudomonadota bacterium]
MKALILPAALAAMAAIPATGRAQLVPESDEPIDITGESLEIIDDVATWTGKVRAVQGDAILTAERLIATIGDDGGFSSIRAVGNIRYFNGKEAITGDSALYDAGARAITVSDNVVVTQGKTVMTGGALVYWIDTGRISFTAPGGQRIRGIFHAKAAPSQL